MNKTTFLLLPLLPLLLAAGGCSARQPSAEAAGATRSDPNIIRRSDLSAAQLNEMSVYQVVQQLRPRFLASLGPTTFGPDGGGLVVYLDATKLGGADTMKDLRMSEVQEVRYLSPSEATLRYGTGHEHGVILLRRARR